MSIEQAVAALKRGEIVGVPTDTLYGLAADPFREDALAAIFDLKGRPATKPLAILVASLEQGMTIASLSDRALDLADLHWPGALTLVLPRLPSAPSWLGHAGRRTVGLALPRPSGRSCFARGLRSTRRHFGQSGWSGVRAQ